VKGIELFYNFVVCCNCASTCISSFKCHHFCFLCRYIKPRSVIIWFNLYTDFCKLSSVLDITTWSLANNSFNSSWYYL